MTQTRMPGGQGSSPQRRALTLTMISPLRPFAGLVLRPEFALTTLLPRYQGIRPLKSVFYTRWSILDTIAYNGAEQIRERPEHPYLIWESIFSVDMDQYIEAFVAKVNLQIKATWWRSYGFPGTRSIDRLRRYIDHLSLQPEYTFAAYPDASVRIVLSALDVDKEHQFLVQAAKASTAQEFAVMYRGFLRRRQADL